MRERTSYPGEPQRAMLHYFADIITFRLDNPDRQRNCDLMLVQGVASEEYVPLGPWQKIWEGARPGDKVERYRLYQRTREPRGAGLYFISLRCPLSFVEM